MLAGARLMSEWLLPVRSGGEAIQCGGLQWLWSVCNGTSGTGRLKVQLSVQC